MSRQATAERIDHAAAIDAVWALGEYLHAETIGDQAGAEAALDRVLAYARGSEDDDDAPGRIAFLSGTIVGVYGEELAAKRRPGQSYIIRSHAGGHAFERLPQYLQVALTATVVAANGDWQGARSMLTRHARRCGTDAAAQVLLALASMHHAEIAPQTPADADGGRHYRSPGGAPHGASEDHSRNR